jgi:hypothetical protein
MKDDGNESSTFSWKAFPFLLRVQVLNISSVVVGGNHVQE